MRCNVNILMLLLEIMDMSLGRKRSAVAGFGVFVLCVCLGIVAGSYIKHRMGGARAASENVTVTNNNQVVSIEQGIPNIARTSMVTVKDASATLGYILKARIENNSIPGSTVAIGSASSSTCTLASPCVITSDPAPVAILETTTNAATTLQGDSTEWTVGITLPGGTAEGNYILDIAYSEEAVVPPTTILDVTYMQDLALPENAEACADTPDRTRTTLVDRRNNQTYYVEKIGDLCWMESNLRYAGDGNYDQGWGYSDDRYATTTSNTTANTYDNANPLTTTASGYLGGGFSASFYYAGYFNPGGSTDYTNTSPGTFQQPSTYGFFGYLYSWCGAMVGQYGACRSDNSDGIDATQTICPAGWRLPTGGPGGEYEALNAIVNNGATDTDQGFRENFLAVYAGEYTSEFSWHMGSMSYYWSSSAAGAEGVTAWSVYFHANAVQTYPSGKSHGHAVRCVI